MNTTLATQLTKLREISNRVKTLKDRLINEESTKISLMLPVLQGLGYDVFNPDEVLPEYKDITLDGVKATDKADLAIKKQGVINILIEAKKASESLEVHHSQLFRYFTAIRTARVGVLTNGIIWKVYTDLEETNILDRSAFLEINLETANDQELTSFIQVLGKDTPNWDEVKDRAVQLKNYKKMLALLQVEFETPSEDFVYFVAKATHDGVVTQKVKDQYKVTLKRVIRQIIAVEVAKELTGATNSQAKVLVETMPTDGAVPEKSKIETIPEELEAYYLVKNLLRKHVDSKRIHYRDAQSYFSVLLDDNNRKPLCRIQFGAKATTLTTFNAQKEEVKVQIAGLDDIYKYEELIVATLNAYLVTGTTP
jgi:predicted type IV restriction endonuclease